MTIRYMIIIIPLCIAAMILGFFVTRLYNINHGQDITKISSALLEQPAPMITLPPLYDGEIGFTPESYQGKVTFLNFFASWCVPCRAEHPYLEKISKNHDSIQMVGLAWRDKRNNTKEFLKELGNPFDITLYNESGDVFIHFGTLGIPESFIIDKDGIIRYKKTGPITPADLEEINKIIKQLL